MNTKLTKIISGLFVATAAFQTASAGNITDIKVSSLPNKQKIVKVSFDKEIVNPTGFVTSSPARIALDFEQTGISMDQQVLEYADPLLSKISAAQNSSRARLVLNLNKPGQYNTEVRGNKVWIFINESDDTVSAPARPAVKAAPAAPAKQQAAAPFTESVVSVSAPFSPAKQQAAASAKQQAATPAKQTNIDFRKDGKFAGARDFLRRVEFGIVRIRVAFKNQNACQSARADPKPQRGQNRIRLRNSFYRNYSLGRRQLYQHGTQKSRLGADRYAEHHARRTNHHDRQNQQRLACTMCFRQQHNPMYFDQKPEYAGYG